MTHLEPFLKRANRDRVKRLHLATKAEKLDVRRPFMARVVPNHEPELARPPRQ